MTQRVSMLVMGHPQFETQDDSGAGHGIAPISEWQLESDPSNGDLLQLAGTDVDAVVKNVFIRLRNIFQRAKRIPFPTTQLHDLTCFVVHRLLLTAPDTADPANSQSSPVSECVRYAIILYMFIIHGPTYYSHAVILNTMIIRFMQHLKQLESTPHLNGLLDVWLVAIGMVSSTGTAHHQWFVGRARGVAASIQLENWNDVLVRIKSILWLETPQGEDIFRPHWDSIFRATSHPGSPDSKACGSPSSTGTVFLRNTISPARLLPGRLESAIQMEGNRT
jgi:hypothetical protein